MAAIPSVFSHATLYVVIGALALLSTAARCVFSGAKRTDTGKEGSAVGAP
jgi:hypothetical protein